jgi:tight adherence protein C
MSLVRGTPLSKMLEDQASSARSEIRNQLLLQAGKNETRMLVPLVFLILPVIVLFAIYPSLKLLNFGFI